jgi:tetratricopeptide (TPR) repeat protein
MSALSRAGLAVLAVGLQLDPAPALADDDDGKQRAQALLIEGNKLLEEDAFAKALDRFERAYAAYPSPALLLNIGTSLKALGRNAKAANTYVRWLHASVNPERRPEVLEVLGKLDHLVARFRIEVSEPDATVTVDGQTIDSEMLATLRLESGSHRVVATKKGFRSTSAMISGDAGETIPVHLVLEKLPSETDPGFSQPATTPHHISTDRHRVRKGGGLRVAGLASAVVGALALGAGVYFGLEANSLDGELADAGTRLSRDDQPWTGDLLAKQGDAETAETQFFALTIAGAAPSSAARCSTLSGICEGGATHSP